MLTSSLGSQSLVRRRVCGLWGSLWLGPFGGLLTEQFCSDSRIVVGTAVGG